MSFSLSHVPFQSRSGSEAEVRSSQGIFRGIIWTLSRHVTERVPSPKYTFTE